ESSEFITREQRFLKRRLARNARVVRVRKDGFADLLFNAALGEDRLTFLRVFLERWVDLPIEVVQQRGDRPLLLVFAELARIRGEAGLDRERVLAQPFGLREFAEKIPCLFAAQHAAYDNASPDPARRAARNASRSRLVTRSVRRPSGVQVSSSIHP